MRLPQIRFSLRGLLAAIAIIAVVLACILNFGLSLPMVTIIWSILLLALMISPVLAFVGLPNRRNFYAGFAWFGWMYLLICVLGAGHSPSPFGGPTSSSALAFPQLVIENGMFMLYKWVVPRESWIFNDSPQTFQETALSYDSRILNPSPPPVTGSVAGMGGLPAMRGAPVGSLTGGTRPVNPALQQPRRLIPWVVCRDIGHALLAALWAILGGCLVSWIGRRNSGREKTNATTAL